MSDFTSTESDIVLIGEIASITRGTINPNESPLEAFNYYSIPGYDLTGGPSKTLGKEIQSNKTILNDECVLVSKLNPRIPRVCLANISGDSRSICSTEFIPLVPKGQAIDLEYLAHYLRSPSFQERFQAAAGGSTNSHSRVTPSEILDWEIFVPPLPEQKKIAEILSGIDKLIIKKEKQICTLENLEKSVLDALTDQELRAGTKCAPLSEIVSPDRKITYGIVQAGPNIKDGIPYIRVTDMSDEELDVNKMLRTSSEIAEKFKRSEVQEGDIVVALRGIIGATHLIDDRTSGANLTQGTALLSRSDKCLPLYVNTIFKSRFCREQFSLLSKGSTIVEITLSSLATLMIPLPSITTQERIANSIASIKCQKSSNKRSLASIRNMKNAIASDLLSGRKRVTV